MEKILDDIFSEQIQRHIIVEENWSYSIKYSYHYNRHIQTMHFNTSFNQFGSISPARSYKSNLKENHNQSVNSNVDSRLKASIST